jgi:hypothetical protein
MAEVKEGTKTEDLQSFLSPKLEDRSIRWLKSYFEKRFEGDNWKDFEPEFLLLELSADFQDVIPLDTIKKVLLLKALEDNPDRFYTDPLFTLHAIEIANGTSHTSAKTIPHVTSLELAYAVNLIGEMYPHEATTSLTKICEFVLREEGFTSPTYPFTFVADESLPETESKADMKKKEKAIRAYLRLMELKDK